MSFVHGNIISVFTQCTSYYVLDPLQEKLEWVAEGRNLTVVLTTLKINLWCQQSRRSPFWDHNPSRSSCFDICSSLPVIRMGRCYVSPPITFNSTTCAMFVVGGDSKSTCRWLYFGVHGCHIMNRSIVLKPVVVFRISAFFIIWHCVTVTIGTLLSKAFLPESICSLSSSPSNFNNVKLLLASCQIVSYNCKNYKWRTPDSSSLMLISNWQRDLGYTTQHQPTGPLLIAMSHPP